MLKTNLRPHPLMSSCHHCGHVYYDCVEYQCDNCHVYTPGHPIRTATTLIIVEAGVFNHSRGVMLRWPHFSALSLFPTRSILMCAIPQYVTLDRKLMSSHELSPSFLPHVFHMSSTLLPDVFLRTPMHIPHCRLTLDRCFFLYKHYCSRLVL